MASAAGCRGQPAKRSGYKRGCARVRWRSVTILSPRRVLCAQHHRQRAASECARAPGGVPRPAGDETRWTSCPHAAQCVRHSVLCPPTTAIAGQGPRVHGAVPHTQPKSQWAGVDTVGQRTQGGSKSPARVTQLPDALVCRKRGQRASGGASPRCCRQHRGAAPLQAASLRSPDLGAPRLGPAQCACMISPSTPC